MLCRAPGSGLLCVSSDSIGVLLRIRAGYIHAFSPDEPAHTIELQATAGDERPKVKIVRRYCVGRIAGTWIPLLLSDRSRVRLGDTSGAVTVWVIVGASVRYSDSDCEDASNRTAFSLLFCVGGGYGRKRLGVKRVAVEEVSLPRSGA